MKIKHGLAALAALAFLFITGVQAFAASPSRVSYQGTLRKNGVLFSGTAAMEFRITNAAGSVVYWASGSTGVVVSTGLFRYALGSPNENDFGNIVWKEITPYVQMNLDGGWLPREPLYTSVYSLHSRTAESSTGTFTINGGDLRLTAASGSKGIYFPDGTSQFSAPGWAVTGSYTSFAGGAGVGTLTPATRLDVQAAVSDTYVQFWRNSTGVIKATMTAAGVLYADGSQLSNLPAGADNMGNHTAAAALLMANFPINNSGAITANGQITTYSSATVAGALGLGVPRLNFRPGVEISSAAAAVYGGVQFSSHVYLPAGAKYYGDGSSLGFQALNASSVTVAGALGVGAAVRFNNNVEISSAAGVYSGIYISTNVNLAAGAKYYGDGSGLTGISGTDNLGNHMLTQSLVTGANWLSFDGSPTGINMDALGNVGIGQAAGSASLDLRGTGGAYVQIWRNNSGVIRASMTAAGAFYADGSQLRNVPAGGTANQALNMASFDIANVSTVTLSSVTSSGIGVVFSTNILLMNGRLGINTALPQESLDVNGSFKSSSLSGSGNQCIYADNAGRLLLSGSGLCGSASGLDNLGNRIMLGNLITGSNWISFDGSNGGLSVNISSNVGIGVLSAATRLDVQARAGDTYAQIWRNSAGIVQASMSATGLIFADASQMRNLPSGGDSFGNHIATKPVNMAGNQMLNVSSVNFSANVEISSSTGLNRGIYVSTNIYIVGVASATKYYGDGSSLTGVISSPDNLGNHTATLNLNMAGKDIVSISTITLSSVTSSGVGVVFSTNVLLMNGRLGINTSLPQESLDVNGNFKSSSLSGSGNQCIYADNAGRLLLSGSGLCGSASGLDNLGNRIMLGNLITGSNWISFDGSNGGLSVNISSNVGIGVLSAATRLDVQARAGDTYAQIWRDSAGVIQASMSATGLLYVDASKMRNLPSGADNLGNHTATLALNLAGNDVIGVSTITLSSVTSSGIGVVFSTNVLLMNGRLGINTALPQESLDVNGNIMSSSLSGAGVRCVSADAAGKLYTIAGPCGNSAGSDNMGDHTMAINLVTGSNWISGDGGNEGIRIDALGNVSIGDSANNARLDVRGAAAGNIQVWRDVAGVTRASISSGGGLAASSATVSGQLTVYSSATVTGALGVGAARFRLSSNVEISSETTASLGAGVRISSNVYIVGFSSAARYYGDGSALTGVSGSDNLGNHIATQNLNLNTFNLVNVASLTARGAITSYSSVTIAGELGLGAALRFNNNVGISSSAAAFNGGLYVSTNVYIVGIASAARYYGDGSALTGIAGGGNVIDTLSATLGAGANAGGLDITNAGNITAAGLGVGIAPAAGTLEVNDADASALTSGLKFTNFSCSGTDKLTVGVDGKVVCQPDAVGGGTGNLVDNLFDTLGMGDDAGGRAIQNAGSITGSSLTVTGALGLLSARVKFNTAVEISSSAAAFNGGLYVSTNVYIVGIASAARYYGDGSALTGVLASPDHLGNHTATQNLNMDGRSLLNVLNITGYAGASVSFSTTVMIGGSIGVSGGALIDKGPVGIGTFLPAASLHISSAAGYAGDMLIISTGSVFSPTNVVRMTGGGEIHATKFFGDGSALTGIAGGGGGVSNPAVANLDMGAYNISNVNELLSSRLAVGNGAGIDSGIISVILGGFDDAEIMNEVGDFNAAVFAVTFVDPTQPRVGQELAIGGSFIGGIEAGNTFSFPTLMGLKTSALSQTAGTVTNAYGLYVQNEQTAGVISNNYGIDIKKPASIQITNNYGLMVRDQFIGTSLSYNIYSEGPNAVNLFEGIVVSPGGVKVDTVKVQPACIVANRGLFWVVQGGAGVKDLVQVCAKDAGDLYAWRPLY